MLNHRGPIRIFWIIYTELQLSDIDQPLKIFYSWQKLLSQHSNHRGEEEVPSLHLWRNTFFPPSQEKMVFDH